MKYKIIQNEELINITGGTAINASLINAIARGAEFLYNLGRSIGSSLRMIITKKSC